MIITFTSQLEGIDWIVTKVQNETQFEILREELLFNYIYTGRYFLDMQQTKLEMLSQIPLWKLGHN
jgi:hypothetical protein